MAGNARIHNGTVDIDAYEYRSQPLLTALTGITVSTNSPQAGTTTSDDLIVLRTTATQNKITLNGTELQININAATHGNVTILSFGSYQLTIDGNGESRIINIASSTEAILAGLTITNSLATDSGGIRQWYQFGGGGGIHNNGVLTVINCAIVGNFATVVVDDIYYNNYGGGIYNRASLTVINSRISNNDADGAYGGALQYRGTLAIDNSTVSDNSSSGVLLAGGTAVITDSVISNNSSIGIFVPWSGELIVMNSHIVENIGGGISSSGMATITSSTVIGNTSTWGSGGIAGSATINNSIIAGNYNATSRGNIGGTFNGSNNLIGDGMRQPRWFTASTATLSAHRITRLPSVSSTPRMAITALLPILLPSMRVITLLPSMPRVIHCCMTLQATRESSTAPLTSVRMSIMEF
ncbi:MAG: right-handed parallel beta-helix repeat-containing protein [Planctomycetaceae bacterium]|nr:right-handed parallel beta-helix repeat-containing protein [Planctomycetaceae bacterium]